MKKYYIVIGCVILLACAMSCKKSHRLPKVPSPNWTVEDMGKYPASMTAVVQVPESLQKHIQNDDKIAAFIGEECRGTGALVTTGSVSAFFILIHGTSSEQSKISFKYYTAGRSNMYETAATLDFTVDGNYGTADVPEILDLKPVK